jgi:hypothetical protein
MLALGLVLLGTLPAHNPLAVRVVPKQHDVVLTFGPVDIPRQAGEHHHYGAEAEAHDLPLMRFDWPINCWANGFRLTLRDRQGRVLSNRLVHHLNVIHLGRRQLVEPVFERTFAIGQETGNVQLPPTIGVRLLQGSPLAVHLAWDNEGDANLEGVTLELAIHYLPANLTPAPREIHPVPLDLGFTPGGSNSFDLPPGRAVFEREFQFPVSGRLLGLGAHLHDYARTIRLEDSESGKVLAVLNTRADSTGRVQGVERVIYGAYGEGLRIRKDGRYRVVAEYLNPTGETIALGGMAILGGIFMPDNPRDWPPLDRSSPGLLADLAMLERRSHPGH